MERPDPKAFRTAVSRFTTGVTIVTTREPDGRTVAMTANSFTSVSLSPPTVLVSLRDGRTLRAIARRGRFGVNVLPASAREISSHFAGRQVPGLRPAFLESDGMPRLDGSIAYFDCHVTQSVVVADHTLLIGGVTGCGYADADPLVFYSSQYRVLGAEFGAIPT